MDQPTALDDASIDLAHAVYNQVREGAALNAEPLPQWADLPSRMRAALAWCVRAGLTTPPAPVVTEAMVEAHAAEQWAMECRERGFSVNPTWEAMSNIFRSHRRRVSRELLTAALRGGAK